MKTEKLECTIEFDYEFFQEECHWDLYRFFRICFKTLDPSLSSSKELYYKLGNYVEVPSGTSPLNYYTRIYAGNQNLFTLDSNTWVYHLNISEMDQPTLVSNRDSEGNFKITAYLKSGSNIVHETFSTRLELPPTLAETKPSSELPNIQTEYVKSNPGESLCSWNPATVADCSANNLHDVDTVDGYSIEIFYKPEDATEYVQLKGIKWNEAELAKGIYKLVKDPTYVEPEVVYATSLGSEASFESTHTMSEVYIENPLSTNFYFTPKTLGILPGSTYQIRIYPYSHYEGALISTQGTSSNEIDVPKGIVRVKTSTGWVEGIVYVMTADGWKEADSIYTMTADGWKETT